MHLRNSAGSILGKGTLLKLMTEHLAKPASKTFFSRIYFNMYNNKVKQTVLLIQAPKFSPSYYISK